MTSEKEEKKRWTESGPQIYISIDNISDVIMVTDSGKNGINSGRCHPT